MLKGLLSVQRILADLLPNIDLPVAGEVWIYDGPSPEK
jgi:hypothetical protein